MLCSELFARSGAKLKLAKRNINLKRAIASARRSTIIGAATKHRVSELSEASHRLPLPRRFNRQAVHVRGD